MYQTQKPINTSILAGTLDRIVSKEEFDAVFCAVSLEKSFQDVSVIKSYQTSYKNGIPEWILLTSLVIKNPNTIAFINKFLTEYFSNADNIIKELSERISAKKKMILESVLDEDQSIARLDELKQEIISLKDIKASFEAYSPVRQNINSTKEFYAMPLFFKIFTEQIQNKYKTLSLTDLFSEDSCFLNDFLQSKEIFSGLLSLLKNQKFEEQFNKIKQFSEMYNAFLNKEVLPRDYAERILGENMVSMLNQFIAYQEHSVDHEALLDPAQKINAAIEGFTVKRYNSLFLRSIAKSVLERVFPITKEYEIINCMNVGSEGIVFSARRIGTSSEDSGVALKVSFPTLSYLEKCVLEDKPRFNSCRNDLNTPSPHVMTISRFNDVSKYRKEVVEMGLMNTDYSTVIGDYDGERKYLGNDLTDFEMLSDFIQIAQGVYEFHKRGLAHRDIKPANILVKYVNILRRLLIDEDIDISSLDLDDYHVMHHPAQQIMNNICHPRYLVLSDNDVATTFFYDENNHLPRGDRYIKAPKVWRGEEASKETDLWSLGSIFYRLITGKYVLEEDLDALEPEKHRGFFENSERVNAIIQEKISVNVKDFCYASILHKLFGLPKLERTYSPTEVDVIEKIIALKKELDKNKLSSVKTTYTAKDLIEDIGNALHSKYFEKLHNDYFMNKKPRE